MYRWQKTKEGEVFAHIGACIQKSIKIDKGTLEIIEECKGRSFSDKIRNMAAEYKRMKG